MESSTLLENVYVRFGKEVLAGGLAGALGKTAVAPLERTKILIQTSKSSSTNLSDVLKYMYRSDGILGLYKGNGASVARAVPFAALHFSTYEWYRSGIIHTLYNAQPHGVRGERAMQKPPPWIDLIAGASSGATATLATYPLDLIRTRLAWEVETSGRFRRVSISGTAQRIIQEEGIGGLYRGAYPTVLGILPYAGLKFFMYQGLKRAWSETHPVFSSTQQRHHGKTSKPPVSVNLVFGGIAGIVAQTITYPLDIIRRRMQVGNIAGTSEGPRATVRATARSILAEHGHLGLFRGLYLNYIKVAPSTAVGFTVYDIMKEALGLENHI